jgi:hypothetical protein
MPGWVGRPGGVRRSGQVRLLPDLRQVLDLGPLLPLVGWDARRHFLVSRGEVLGDQLGLKANDGVRVGDDRLRIVLRLVPGSGDLIFHVVRPVDEGSLARGGPVGRALGGNLRVGYEAVELIWWVRDCPIVKWVPKAASACCLSRSRSCFSCLPS